MLTGFAMTKGYRNYPGLGWQVVARRPTATAYAPARSVARTIFGLGLVIGGIGIGLATVFSGRVARPIRRLTEEADRIGRDPGKVMLPHVQGSVEVAQLSSALRSLLRRLDLTEQAMAEVEERSAEETRKLNENIDALKELADTDPLTALPNRRGMVRFGDDVMAGYNRDGRLFAVLVVDIDRFKAINDTHGHAVGDDVIRHVARLAEAAIRPTDRVARFGGEEFVAVLRDVQLIRAGDVAERLRMTVESTPFRHGDAAIATTVSVGVAMIAPGDRDLQDVIERADMALYDAKSAGRNRISISRGRRPLPSRRPERQARRPSNGYASACGSNRSGRSACARSSSAPTSVSFRISFARKRRERRRGLDAEAALPRIPEEARLDRVEADDRVAVGREGPEAGPGGDRPVAAGRSSPRESARAPSPRRSRRHRRRTAPTASPRRGSP